MSRDRQGYDIGLSIRRLIDEGWFTGETAVRMSAIGTMTIDGRPLIDEPYWMRTDSSYEIRSAPKHSELLLAAHALHAAGERDTQFESRERPDFSARLSSGRRIGVEVTEIIAEASSHRANALTEMNIALREAMDADPTVGPPYTYLAFNFQPMLREMPNAVQRKKIVAEILNITRSRAWTSYVPAFPGRRPMDSASMLDRFGIWLHIGELPDHPGGHIDVHGPATTFAPDGLALLAADRLSEKREKAGTYDVKPLWLVLALTDQQGIFTASVEQFSIANLKLDPFERVLVFDWHVIRCLPS